MKKKFFFPLFWAIVIGFIFAQAIYKEYRSESSKKEYNTYILQEGVYSDKDVLEEHLKNLNKYILMEEDGKYYVYLSITTSLDNANKLKSLYEEKKIPVSVKKANISNVAFVTNLEQYDLLLEQVETSSEIFAINETILSSYEELILGK